MGVRGKNEPMSERSAQHRNTYCPELRTQASVQPISCPIPCSWPPGHSEATGLKAGTSSGPPGEANTLDKATHCPLGCWKHFLPLPSDTDVPPGPALMLSGMGFGGGNLGLLASSRGQSSLPLPPRGPSHHLLPPKASVLFLK